jgi:hypothetical protein
MDRVRRRDLEHEHAEQSLTTLYSPQVPLAKLVQSPSIPQLKGGPVVSFFTRTPTGTM